MGKLENFSTAELRAIGRRITRGSIDLERMSGPDIATVITGRYASATIADAIRACKALGEIGQSAGASNLQALNFGACPLVAATGAKESDGSDVLGPCTLLQGHDGPCLPKASAVSNALKKAMGRPPHLRPPSEDTSQSLLEGEPETAQEAKRPEAGSEGPELVTKDEMQGLIGELDEIFSKSNFVTRPELMKATNDTLEAATQRADEKIDEARKLLSSALEAHVAAYVKDMPTRPVTVEIHLPELPKATQLKRRPHAAFHKVLCLVRAGLNVMLIGPAGSGKTTLAEDIAIALNRSFIFQSCTAGMSEGQLVGRLLPLGVGGGMRYVSSPFICGFTGEKNEPSEDGLVNVVPEDSAAGVTLLDELDGMDANVGLILNSALANGKLTIEARAANNLSTLVVKHKNNVIIGSANTFGTGMDLQYAGRNALDAAFLDRWYPVFVSYDPVLEAQIAGLSVPQIEPWRPVPLSSEAEWRSLSRWVLETRTKINDAGLRKIWGTRALLKAKAARYAGIPSNEVKADLMLGWPADHVRKVLE